MKRMFLAAAALCVCGGAAAQTSTEAVLRDIETNNKELQALRKDNEAAGLEIRTQNSLEDPSVEYSPFFAHGADGMSSSELVVSQGFDFPTLYAARHKSGKLQREALVRQYMVARRDLLLEAQMLCFDVIRLERERALLERRLANADELLALFEKRLSEGDATAIEVNKIRMERMNARTELAQNETDRRTALESLRAMNGDEPVELAGAEYPAAPQVGGYDEFRERVMSGELEILAADAEVSASKQEVRVSRQNWLPKIEVGYRRNTDMSDAVHGFLVGGSFPIFSGRHKAGVAKARYAASQLRGEDVRVQTEARIRSQFDEMERLRVTLDTYDVALMRSTLGLLRKAVENGQLSVIEYYTEADGIYGNLLAYNELENRYRKLLAEMNRNDL